MDDCDSPAAATTLAVPLISSSSKRKADRPVPKQRSCDGCRIRKIACSYRSEPLESSTPASPAPSSSNATPPARVPCRACASKGINCTIANEGVPFTRNRSGKNVRKAIALGHAATASASIQQSSNAVIIPSQEPLNAVAITGRIGHLLIGTCSGPTELQDTPPFCVPIFDKWSLCHRYEAAGTRLEQLCLPDQVLVSIMLAMGARKVSDEALGAWSRNNAYAQLAERAVSLADQAALWRKTDPYSINVMIMLWQLLSDGDLTAREGRQHLKAAIASLEELARAASPLVDRAISGYDCYLAILLIDSASALETCEEPLLPQSVVGRFTRTLGLPDIAWLEMLSRQPGLACLATITGEAIEHANLLLRMVAMYAATSATAPVLGSHSLLWSQLDELAVWLDQTQQLRTVDSDIALYIDMIWCIKLTAEAGLARAFDQAARLPYLGFQGQSSAQHLSRHAWQRAAETLCSFLGACQNDPHGRNTLALMSGILWSRHRLRDFCVNMQGLADYGDLALRLEQAERNVARAYSLPSLLTAPTTQAYTPAHVEDSFVEVTVLDKHWPMTTDLPSFTGDIAVTDLDDLFLMPLLTDTHWTAI